MGIRIKQNGQWVNVSSSLDLDSTLSVAGKAADAKAVGDEISNLPIAQIETNTGTFTELLRMRQATQISFEKIEGDSNSILITTTLNSGESYEAVVTLDGEGYPTNIQVNGTACGLSWDGFN